MTEKRIMLAEDPPCLGRCQKLNQFIRHCDWSRIVCLFWSLFDFFMKLDNPCVPFVLSVLIILVWSCLEYFKPWSLFGNLDSFWAIKIVWKIRPRRLETIFFVSSDWCFVDCLIFRNNLMWSFSLFFNLLLFSWDSSTIANKCYWKQNGEREGPYKAF